MNLRAPLLAVVLVASSVACPLLTGRSVFAQGDATVEAARQRFKEGVQFYDQHDYEKARLAFLQAYALKPHPSVLLNLAQSELRGGHPADAAAHFAQYLRENTEGSAAERKEAETAFSTARTKVAEVRLDVDTEGAEVSVDGEAKGKSPLSDPLYLMPGTHSIEARAGDQSGRTSLTVTAGQSTTSQIRLSQPSAAAAPAAAQRATTPAAGAETETLPPETPRPPEAEEPETNRESFPSWFASKPLAWVGAGMMIVGAAGGVGFALAAQHDYSSADGIESDISAAKAKDRADYAAAYNQDPTGKPVTPDNFFKEGPCSLTPTTESQLKGTRVDEYEKACSDYKNRVDAGDTKKTIAIAGFVVGGVGAVITLGHVIYYLSSSPTESAKNAPASRKTFAVVPVVSPTFSGFALSGAF